MGRDRQEADLTERAPATAAPGGLALGALFVACFAALVAGEPRVENDVYWHLAIGREIAAHGVPRTDPFAFSTDGIAWSPPEWLSELGMFRLEEAAGLGALALVRYGLVLALAALLWSRARVLGAPPVAALLGLGLASVPAGVHLPMRPLLLGHVLTALVLDQLARLRAGRPHAVALLPLVFVLWANLHPSWPVGLSFVGLAFAVGVALPRLPASARLGLGGAALDPRAARTLGIALALSCLAPLVRPDALDGALYPFVHLVGLGAEASEIIEWFPLSAEEPLHVATVLGLLLLLVALVRTRARRDAFDLLLVALTLALAVGAQRFLPLVTVAVGPIAAALLGERFPRLALDPAPALRVAAGLVALALMFVGLPSGGSLVRDEVSLYPVRAAAFIEEHGLPERAFNTFEHGGYLLWRFAGRRVYIDSRFDLYARTGVFREYLRLRRGEDVLAILDARAIDAAILPTPALDENFLRMTETLRAAGWREVFADEVAVVLLRAGAPSSTAED